MEIDTLASATSSSSSSRKRTQAISSRTSESEKRRVMADEHGDPHAINVHPHASMHPFDFGPGNLVIPLAECEADQVWSLFRDLQSTLDLALKWSHLAHRDFACKHDPHGLPSGHACVADLEGGKLRVRKLLGELRADHVKVPVLHVAISMMLHTCVGAWQDVAIECLFDGASMTSFASSVGESATKHLGSVVLSQLLYTGKRRQEWKVFCEAFPSVSIDVFMQWYATIGSQDTKRTLPTPPDFGFECQLTMARTLQPQWNKAMASVRVATRTEGAGGVSMDTFHTFLRMLLLGHESSAHPVHLLWCRDVWTFVSKHLPSSPPPVATFSKDAWIQLVHFVRTWSAVDVIDRARQLSGDLVAHVAVCEEVVTMVTQLVPEVAAFTPGECPAQQADVAGDVAVRRVTGRVNQIMNRATQVLSDVARFVLADVPADTIRPAIDCPMVDGDDRAREEDDSDDDDEDPSAVIELLRTTALINPPPTAPRMSLSVEDNASPCAFSWTQDTFRTPSDDGHGAKRPNPLPRASHGYLTEQSWLLLRSMRDAVDLLEMHEADARMHAELVADDMAASLKEFIAVTGLLLDGFRSWLHTTLRLQRISPVEFIRCFSSAYGQAAVTKAFQKQPAYCTALFALLTFGSRIVQLSTFGSSAEAVARAWKDLVQRNVMTANVLCRMVPQTQLFMFPAHEKWWSHALTPGSLQQRIDAHFPSYPAGPSQGMQIEVERNETAMHLLGVLFEDPINDVQNFQSRPPAIRFRDEPGIGQGVFSEFINVASTQVFTEAERFDDWQFCEISGTYGPTPKVMDGTIEPSFAYQVAGFVVALAARKRIKLPIMLHTFFLHPAVRRPTDVSTHKDNIDCWTLSLCEYYDLELATNLADLYKMQNAELASFSFSAGSRHELKLEKPLWSDIPQNTVVTRDNLDAYIRGVVRFRLFSDGQDEAWKQVLAGFHRVIPSAALDALDLSLQNPTSILRFFCGEENCMPDVDRFMKAVTYGVNNQFREHQVVGWFWEIVRSWDASREQIKRHLLLFWTSTPFVDVYRVDANHPLSIVVGEEAQVQNCTEEDDCFPRSATCFRLLYLPTYSSKDVLQRKLEYAVTHHHSSFGVA